MNIYEYLCREAAKISSSSLADLGIARFWSETEDKRRKKLAYMLGLHERLHDNRKPPRYIVTGEIERKGYVVKKVLIESIQGLYVTGSLYLPSQAGRMPAVLYLCGHAQNQKYHYQAHAHKFASLGFVTLVIETIQLGEIPGYHRGTHQLGMFNWYSRGYTPAGVEVWNAMRAIDLLQSLPQVDPNRIGTTGISGGGAMTWFTSAMDTRVKVAAPVCGTATIESHICRHTLEGHCDCMFWINVYQWDLSDIGALIAPRPLLIASAARDWIFDIKSVEQIYEKLKALYELLGAGENIKLVETPGGHSYHEKSRKEIFAWFMKHLKGAEVSPEELGDIDERPEALIPLEELRVLNEIPADERVTDVQDWFVSKAKPPMIESPGQLQVQRERLVKALMKDTFNHFPPRLSEVRPRIELEQEAGERLGYLITYSSEDGWNLRMHVDKPKNADRAPLLVYIARNARNLYFRNKLLDEMSRDWVRAVVEVRGIGETSWGQNLQWFIRRAAMLTGRTIASMRIQDAVAALYALEKLDWVERRRIALMGSGEMAVIAIYAALIKGGVHAIILHEPPPTHDEPSSPDGSGAAIELLNILRHTDLPYAAGMLWPTLIYFLGPRPPAYMWTEELYRKLGRPGAVYRIKSLKQLT